jgi:hypothetical protein
VLSALEEAVEFDEKTGRHFVTQADVAVMLTCVRLLSRVRLRHGWRSMT